MKKILATLLVATMLLSCISFVGFAEEKSTFYTIENYPAESMGAGDPTAMTEGIYDKFGADVLGQVLALYNAHINTGSAIKKSAYKNLSPIYTALLDAETQNKWLYNEVDNNDEDYFYEDYVNPMTNITSVKAATEIVAFPLYAGGSIGVNSGEIQVLYDAEIFTPIKYDIRTGWTNNILSDGVLFVSFAESNPANGYLGSVFFKINTSAIGDDANGNKETKIKFALLNKDGGEGFVKYAEGQTTPASVIGNTTMTVSITGLQPKQEEPVEDVYMTESEVANAATAPVVAAKGDVSEGWAGTTTVISGDDKDITAAEKYSAVFGTIAIPTGKKLDARGFVLVDAKGNETFYAAKAITANGQFGIAFFGTEATLAKYKAAPAAMANGEILYDANDLAAL